MLYLVVVVAIVASAGNPTCAGLDSPVGGAIIEPFAPIGRYAGHWGIDFAVPSGTAVRAADAGVVTFTGVVVGNRTVTIDHGGVRTSYSFLTRILTDRGATVRRGQVIAVTGSHRGRPSLHFSVRIGEDYVDPEPWLVCRGDPGPGLWLRSTMSAYPGLNASDHGRNLRPTTRGTPGGGGVRPSPATRRRRDVDPGWFPMAEGVEGGLGGETPVGDDPARRRWHRLFRGR
ncbi:MAG: hypothetical protein BMS9Abin07_2299 [Acidimicrobiia bacterium]|nr:MAG: hypothetical protein BMS9Abin07_2299 [Acidimicrobiia bacterium]